MAKHTDCQNCQGWATETRGKMTSFVIAGVSHVAPDMWLAGRSSRAPGEGMDQIISAMNDWADGCAMAIQFEQQTDEAIERARHQTAVAALAELRTGPAIRLIAASRCEIVNR